ncbi:MAG: hypothetical protein B5M54_05425 [Candidatus Aminicenantes bacterium 4484_214]|nr:MAG: hypothetical protein B5M54_05425 [Candidatus Aminicenantes bacterium 4484_214]HDJ24125.1 response regulator [Candidatus Aminicenantes bacterium]
MKPRVIIVEDEGLVAMDLAGRLEDLGYKVEGIAHSGKEALRLAEMTLPEIVVMDIGLPGEIDGLTAARLIKEKFKTEIIILTGYTREKIKSQLDAIEPLGILTKPFDDQDLVRVLKKFNQEPKLKL